MTQQKKIFYEKKGSRYYPVSEYDPDLVYALPKGAHMILVYPGGQSTKYNVDPNYAAMIAAGRVAEDAISKAIMDSTEIRRNYRSRSNETPLTPEQKAAWEHLVEVFGDDAKQLEWPAARECAEAGINAIMEEAEKLMTVPSVKKAYEHFLLMCELTKDHTHESDS